MRRFTRCRDDHRVITAKTLSRDYKGDFIGKAVDQLAAYEDTGLTPTQVKMQQGELTESVIYEKIAKYAAECGISERNFYACFKKWCGKTPVDYRNEIRMSAATSLLKRSNLSVAEIAFKTGFEDPYYFSRIFKKSTGLSPAAYRKRETVL